MELGRARAPITGPRYATASYSQLSPPQNPSPMLWTKRDQKTGNLDNSEPPLQNIRDQNALESEVSVAVHRRDSTLQRARYGIEGPPVLSVEHPTSCILGTECGQALGRRYRLHILIKYNLCRRRQPSPLANPSSVGLPQVRPTGDSGGELSTFGERRGGLLEDTITDTLLCPIRTHNDEFQRGGLGRCATRCHPPNLRSIHISNPNTGG